MNIRRLIALFILLSLQCLLFSQGGWQWQNPLPQGEDLKEVWTFDNSLKVISLTVQGSIVQSVDAGHSWRVESIEELERPSGLWFADPDTGWILNSPYSDSKSVLKTVDGGNNWLNIHLSTNKSMGDICFPSTSYGWIVGHNGLIFMTDDGGTTWYDQSINISSDFFGVSFIDPQIGWTVGGSGIVAKTINGGQNWTYSGLDGILQLLSVSFVDSSRGWIAGMDMNWRGIILRTVDGGNSWDNIYTTQEETFMRDIYFIDNDHGWSCTNTGMIYSTNNGGDSWNIYEGDTKPHLRSVHFTSGGNGWVAGDDGEMFKSTDYGVSWDRVSHGTRPIIKDLYFQNQNDGWAATLDGSLLETENSGRTWQEYAIDSNSYFRTIQFISDDIGWTAGSYLIGGIQGGIIFKTIDGGSSWNFVQLPSIKGFLEIDFVNSNIGWGLGWVGNSDRIIMKTIDGGDSWAIQYYDSTESDAGLVFSAIDFVDTLTGWAASSNSDKILKTVDGGNAWDEYNLNAPTAIWDIFFLTHDLGWAALGSEIFAEEPMGGIGYIYHTIDGGQTWELQDDSAGDQFLDIFFSDSLVGCAVGYRGQIFQTQDGGNNWYQSRSGTGKTLQSVFFVDSTLGWVAGNEGTILSNSYGGQLSIKYSDITDPVLLDRQIELFPAYPNPFNSFLNISFSLSIERNLKLSIFDLLGREVAILYNKVFNPGIYRLSWDGKNEKGQPLPSGIYFVELLSLPEQRDIQKMVV